MNWLRGNKISHNFKAWFSSVGYMFLKQNYEKTEENFIMFVCVYLKHKTCVVHIMHKQKKSKTHVFCIGFPEYSPLTCENKP